MTDATPEAELPDVEEERALEYRERQAPRPGDGADEADAVDRLHEADQAGHRLPPLRDDVSEADALDQATPVSRGDDDEDYRG